MERNGASGQVALPLHQGRCQYDNSIPRCVRSNARETMEDMRDEYVDMHMKRCYRASSDTRTTYHEDSQDDKNVDEKHLYTLKNVMKIILKLFF